MRFAHNLTAHITLHCMAQDEPPNVFVLRALIPSSCPRCVFDCLLVASSFCPSPVTPLLFTSSLPYPTCTLTSTSFLMSTASRELTTAPSHNEEYCPLAIYHLPIGHESKRLPSLTKTSILQWRDLQQVSFARSWTPPRRAGEARYWLTDWFHGRNVARRNRRRQSTPRMETTHPDCGILPLAERDQEVGQRICSTTSQRTDAQLHRQSGLHESGPRNLPQSDGIDGDKVEFHNLKDKVLAFIRNNTSGTAPMDVGNIAPGQTPAPCLGSSSQSIPSSSHGGSDSFLDLNNYEHPSQWGQDWNIGDADTSGSSDGELHGWQKGKGKAKVQVSTASDTNVESQVIEPNVFMQRW